MSLHQIESGLNRNPHGFGEWIFPDAKRPERCLRPLIRSASEFSWGESEHLTYLDRPAPMYADEHAKKTGRKELCCANCEHPVTKVSEQIEIWGSHEYTFGNLGYPVKLGCFRNAPGCIGTNRISHGYSWFRGYAWEIQLCSNCYVQLGWKYMTPDDVFYGLIFGMLREQDPEEENPDIH